MNKFRKSAKILTATFLAAVLLLTSGPSIALAGSDHEKARDAVREYGLTIRPDDTNGILLLEEAVFCFWLALELRRQAPGHPDPGVVASLRGKCRIAEADADIEDAPDQQKSADVAMAKGLGDMLGGLVQILIEVLKK